MERLITVTQRDGGLWRDDDAWPPVCDFAPEVVITTPELRPKPEGCVTLRLMNGTAVYRIVERSPRVWTGELVYAD